MVRTRKPLGPYTVVIKLGTSSIIHETTHQPLLSTLSAVVETCVKLRAEGHKVVLVSSGAIGVGMKRMELPGKPKSLSGRQALAAIGQGRLIALWDNLFSQLGQPIAQVLLTRGDVSDRSRYLNAVNTFTELLGMGVVPIVNENDTVSVSEIRFGDNDTLSAITASMVHADYLFLLTDVEALYTSNPRKDPDAKAIDVVQSVSEVRKSVSTATLGSKLGTGGMETKLIAAEIATAAGVATVITSSKNPTNVFSIIEYNTKIQKQLQSDSTNSNTPSQSQTSSNSTSGVTTPSSALTSISMGSEDTVTTLSVPQSTPIPDPSLPSSSQTSEVTTPLALVRPPHTLFLPSTKPLRDAKSWTAYTLAPAGSVIIDAGAHRVLAKRDSGGRLLAVGVVGVAGTFAPGQAVRIVVRKRTEKAEKAANAAVAHIHKELKDMKAQARQSAIDSGTGSPVTPATPSLLPTLSTISVSSLEPFSRSESEKSLTDPNEEHRQTLDSTPLAGTIALPSENNSVGDGKENTTKGTQGDDQDIAVPLTGDDKKPKETIIQYSAASEEGWIDVEVGRGLANYNSVEISKIKGMKSANIVQVLGYVDAEYVVENITIHLAP